jgi:hypothetical protein
VRSTEEPTLEAFDTILQYVNIAAFVGLALLTLRQWRRRRDEGSRWALLTFASLAIVAAIGVVLPDDAEGLIIEYAEKLLIALLLLFPYFLFRLATSFSETGSRIADRGAAMLTAVVVVWAIVMPRFPDPGDPRTTAFNAFIIAVLAQWVLLSGFVAVRFWRTGAGQPDVARKRMRMLSAAATAMSLAIVISGTASDQDVTIDVVVQLIALAAVGAFFIAFSPPAWLVAVWRRTTQAEARRATMSVLSSSSPAEVVENVLPHAVATVGGRSIAMFDNEGNLLGAAGFEEDELAELDPSTQLDPHRYVCLKYPFGSLVVRTTPHMHFFGEDDINLLGAIGTVANLALQRLDSIKTERKLAEAKLRRRQALEINDNIVQRLVVAHYAFELGRTEEGKEATEAALKAAQRTVSDLVGEISAEEPFGRTPLTREQPAG